MVWTSEEPNLCASKVMVQKVGGYVEFVEDIAAMQYINS